MTGTSTKKPGRSAASKDGYSPVNASRVHQEKLASIGQLAAGVAHELNNPLGFLSSNFRTMEDYIVVMKSYIDLLEKALSGDMEPALEAGESVRHKVAAFRDEEGLDYILEDLGDLVSESREGMERMTTIIQKLRSFSRVDQDEKIEDYDLNKAVESALAVAGSEIRYHAEVVTDLHPLPKIRCRSDEINTVLLNLLLNASQAFRSLPGSGRKGRIEIKTYRQGKHVCCRIADDGPGIDPSVENRVFDPFFTTKSVGSGTGLGLSISYDIVVRKHGGELTFESEEEQGVVFVLKLPVHPDLNKEVK